MHVGSALRTAGDFIVVELAVVVVPVFVIWFVAHGR
jgi:hypothetical protein